MIAALVLALTPGFAAAAAGFEVAVGSVRDAATGAALGGATLTFTPLGTDQGHPPGPIRTNGGGRFATP